MTREAITLDQQWVPSACTLPTAEQPLRVAEFDVRVPGQHVKVLDALQARAEAAAGLT
ncbi:hypothetical protein ACWEPL_20370 [Nonomuraea sp. NPDC004186]